MEENEKQYTHARLASLIGYYFKNLIINDKKQEKFYFLCVFEIKVLFLHQISTYQISSVTNNMKFRLLFIVLFICLADKTFSQNISVRSFKLLDTDLTANTKGTSENDQNGETAALIKIVTTETGFSFDCGMLGIVKTKQTPGEVWLYLPRGAQKITIKHPQLGVLRNYYFPVAIEGARTYEMVLTTGKVLTVVREARTSQYVLFQLSPKNAIVEFDGQLLQTTDGLARKLIKFGTYNYKVQAPDYLPYYGKITVDDPDKKAIVDIKLEPNFTPVTLVVSGGAEIWVNGEKKGQTSWSGNLGAGEYEFEARKENHSSTICKKIINVPSEPQTFQLDEPKPILGEANIDSNPAMADIFIDNINIGKTPLLTSEILIGSHILKISKDGYETFNKEIVIEENIPFEMNAQLKKIADKEKTSEVISSNGKRNGNEVFKFHDVEANEAQGKVKSISSSVKGMLRKTTFTADGKMQQEGLTDAKYDAEGYIQECKMSVQGQETTVKYAWENGKLISQTTSVMGQEIKQTFVYDEKGLVKAQKMNMMGQDVEMPFSDYKFDDKGNWTSRKTSMMGQEMEMTRTITYYE